MYVCIYVQQNKRLIEVSDSRCGGFETFFDNGSIAGVYIFFARCTAVPMRTNRAEKKPGADNFCCTVIYHLLPKPKKYT